MQRGLVVDLFAGGGGASTGIEAAIGRPVDVAINHDAVAMAVHKANHPETVHLEADIWEVRPAEATKGRPVELLWASPDCTHFSSAKGDVPRRQAIRSLAWAVVRWAKAVRPSVIILENVSEFRSWGPLGKDGRPVKRRLGVTFLRWKGQLERAGYRVDFRILDASLYGAPTRRRRLFIVARCDGRPIRWPEPTHGPGLLPVRTAAECIDWSLPCPSIFERKRPLAEKTLWRIAQGIRRFVLENPRPFIVGYHSERPGAQARVDPLSDPLPTQTTENRFGLVTPVLATIDQRGTGDRASTAPNAPLPTTVTKNRHALIAPSLVKVNHGKRDARGEAIEEPLTTVTAERRGHALVAPTLIQTGYGERDGQAARVPGLDKPLGTAVAGGQKHALVSAFLAKHFGGVVGQEVRQPASTITSKDHHSLAAATLMRFNHDDAGVPLDEPLPTVAAQGLHVAEVRAFLTAFYGQDGGAGKGQSLRDPLRTVTAKHRLGLVTVEGTEYQIVDIGMRMLEPHELARAQFGRFADRIDLSAARTKAKKVHLIGNSVCPEVAEVLVAANVGRDEAERASA
jgi:DNA (cytosine-5)-methyltransferase 1